MSRPKVIIIGAGFGGLYAARQFRDQDVDVLLIDRNNYHTFTPLLYQVATSGLDSSEIAYPVRSIFRHNKNIQFLLGEVQAIDTREREVHILAAGEEHIESYDYLVFAPGAVTNYLNNDSIERFGFGLKDLADAVGLRNHILRLFERAAWEQDLEKRKAMMTLVVVGGGPTGLETAGALYELYNHVLTREYNQSRLQARVVLVEAMDNLLAAYPESLQKSAKQQLESLGVEVILGKLVESVERNRVIMADGEVINTHTLVWAAGVKGSPLVRTLGIEPQKGGRIAVKPTMEIDGLERVYAVGDITYLENKNGQPYPQLIPVAQQQGRLAAKNILRRIGNETEAPFKYNDRGIMATIGRRRAVAWPFYKVKLTGWFAWVSWLGLHLIWLLGFRNRLNVLINWIWNYFTYDRSVRLILDRVDRRPLPPDTDEEEAVEDPLQATP